MKNEDCIRKEGLGEKKEFRVGGRKDRKRGGGGEEGRFQGHFRAKGRRTLAANPLWREGLKNG